MRIVLGIALGIAVNFIWGLAFLLPHIYDTFDPILLTSGRYVAYGILSVLLILCTARGVCQRTNALDWQWAFAFAFAGNIGYYAIVVFAIRLGGVPITAVVIGVLPVTLAIYGNFREQEFSMRQIAGPIALIFIGLATINGVGLLQSMDQTNLLNTLGGILLAFAALALWTWYGVNNARYLKWVQHETPGRISDADWSALIGVATLLLTILGMLTCILFGWLPLRNLVQPFTRWNLGITFVTISIVLGVVVSWFATLLWNKASRILPVSIAGQLVVFETISSILYVSVWERKMPTVIELVALTTIIFGVIAAIRRMQTLRLQSEATAVESQNENMEAPELSEKETNNLVDSVNTLPLEPDSDSAQSRNEVPSGSPSHPPSEQDAGEKSRTEEVALAGDHPDTPAKQSSDATPPKIRPNSVEQDRPRELA